MIRGFEGMMTVKTAKKVVTRSWLAATGGLTPRI